MALLVEGQLRFLRFVGKFSEVSHSETSSNMRSVIRATSKMQTFYPSMISGDFRVSPTIEENTGKVVSKIG